MYAHVKKKKENKVRPFAKIVDNKNKTIEQKKFQGVVHSCSQLKLEADNYSPHNMRQSVTQFARGKKSKHNRKDGRLLKMQGLERSIPIEEERGFSIISQSETINPYTSNEVMEILEDVKPGDLFYIDPSRVRTMHAGISNRFSNDDEIIDLVEKLKKDPSYIDKTPPIKVAAIELPKRKWEQKDQIDQRNTKELTLFTEDHRRVVAARMAGIKKMRAQIKADPSVTGNFTTKNGGLSVDIRKYHKTEDGRHQGGNKTTLPSSARVYKYSESQG